MTYNFKTPDQFLRQRKKVKEYPLLKREKRVHNPALPLIGVRNKPVAMANITWADLFNKSDRTYNPNHLNSKSTYYYLGTQSYVKRPDWKTVIAKGQNATNFYERLAYSATPLVVRGVNESALYRANLYSHLPPTEGITTELEWVSLDAEAAAKVRHKLDGNIGRAQLAAPLAESREIHRLVRQINTLGLDTVKALLAIRKTKGLSAFKQFGNIWLGFGFGVNPLLKDIQSAANSILDYTTREDRHVRVSGTASREHHSFYSGLGGDIAQGLTLNYTIRGEFMQSSRMVAGVDLKLRSAASYSVLDHLGLKVEALPSTLWELTPFSWVVDYGLTVGPWLEDMFYTLPGVVKYCSSTQKYHGFNYVEPVLKLTNGYKFTGSATGGVLHKMRLTRNPGNLYSVRPIRIKTMDQVANNGLSKLLNLGSVLAQKWGPRL